MNWRRQAIYAAVAILFISPIAAPRLLAFPYSTQIGSHHVYSEQPITPQLESIVARADALAAKSPISDPSAHQPIFLTNGGWRWSWLALGSRDAFALSRPVSEAIVINRSDQATDVVLNGRRIGGRRSLSGTIAHEMTHGAIRRHFGLFADAHYPAWLREGYCDYVAGGGSLTDADAARLNKSDPQAPALAYWRGRKRVEAELQRNGGSVDTLFASAGS